jgi:hypothetical protein
VASHSRTPSTVEDPLEDIVILCDYKAAFRADLQRLPAPARRFKTAGQCAKCLQKLVRRPQRIVVLVSCGELEALRPLIEAASAPMIAIVYGDDAQRHKSAKVCAVSSLEAALEVAESRLSERVFVPPGTADIRENLEIPSLFWLDDSAPRTSPGVLVYDTAQKAIRSMERQMHAWHNTCGHCVTGKRCANCNRAYWYAKKASVDRAPWLGETRLALVSAHLAPPLLDYLGRFPKGNGPFSEIAVYGPDATLARSTDLPLRTFSSFEDAANALTEAAAALSKDAEVKEEASSTGSTHTPEPAGHAQADLSEYSDLNEHTNSDVASQASFADTDESFGDFRASTPLPDDFFGPLRDPRIDFPEFDVNARFFHCEPATQAQDKADSVVPLVLPGHRGACQPHLVFGMVGYDAASIPMAW